MSARPAADILPLRDLDSAITGALRRHREALSRVAALEAAPPGTAGWGATTHYQSRLALARRQCEEAQAELRTVRIRALTARLELLRTPARPIPLPVSEPEQQQLLAL